MKRSRLLTKTRREAPVDEVADNAKLLIRAGYINKAMSGVYDFLPLGLRAMDNIMAVIREEMNAVGGQEVRMGSLQNPDLWKKSERWGGDADEVWFRSSLNAGGAVGFGWTHEEPVTDMMRNHIHSYRDLPLHPYQFQTKFRNEKRAKSGIMRTREFIMKDMYSFCADDTAHAEFYEQCADAYMRVFTRLGIGRDTYRTFASGGAFSEFSDEFQTLIGTGEDTVYVHKERRIALNKEVYSGETLKKLGIEAEELSEETAAEVGNIFTLGTRFSEALNLTYTDADGKERHPFMGCYGIGPARLLGVITEKFRRTDGDTMLLPSVVAPYTADLLALGADGAVRDAADELYTSLMNAGIPVLYDDRDVPAGEKFADHDLLGIPVRLVISEKTLASSRVEYTDGMSDEPRMLERSASAVGGAVAEYKEKEQKIYA